MSGKARGTDATAHAGPSTAPEGTGRLHGLDGLEVLDGLDERARAGIEHLQAAAREAIGAARALLDVAEELVTDPAALQSALGSLGSVLQAALGSVRVPGSADGHVSDPGGDGDEGKGGRVQRIKLRRSPDEQEGVEQP
jgi:hypothetical protein